MQANEEQTEGTLSKIKKSLGLVSLSGGEEVQEEDAIEMLKRQHREVEILFAEIKGAGEKAHKTKERLLATLAEKLNAHAEIEEKVFYPSVREVDKDLVLEAVEEHVAMKTMLKRTLATKGNDEFFDARVTVLKEIIEHHVKEEEKELFPKVQSSLDSETLARIGQSMRTRMEKMKKAPKTRAKKTATKRQQGSKGRKRTAAKKRTTGSKRRAA